MMSILAAVPIVAYCVFYFVLRGWGEDRRVAALEAAVGWGLSVACITEVLSSGRAIAPGPVAAAWAGIAALVLALQWQRFVKGARAVRKTGAALTEWVSPLGRFDRILLGAIGLIVLLVGITALACPPNIWDAMEYHMPRVVMWMSNRSVALYPTPDYAQAVHGPFAEFAMMHLDLLWGSDRLVNLVETFSFIGSLLAVSLIARMLGAGATGEILAAVTCATVTEGVLEASGAMNTYVVSFWVTTAVALLMVHQRKPTRLHAWAFAGAVSLGILTKGTSYILLPLTCLAVLCTGVAAPRRRFWEGWLVALAIVIVVNAPQAVRAYSLTGSPLGNPFPAGGPLLHFSVTRVSIGGAAANVLRNLSLHLGTPSGRVNDAIEGAVRWAIRALGQDPDDQATVWIGWPFHINSYSRHEINAGSGVHLVLLMGAAAWAATRRRDPALRNARFLLLGIAGSFVLFCALVRWQEWGSRFHLTFFVLGSAVVGLFLERLHPRVGRLAGVALIAYGLRFAVGNYNRELIPLSSSPGASIYRPRAELYFADYHADKAPVAIQLADAVNRTSCDRVAIDSYVPLADRDMVHSPSAFYVYPIMALIHAGEDSRRVWYDGVQNLTKRFTSDHREACAVICMSCSEAPEKWTRYANEGRQASVFGDDVLFGERSATATR